MIGGVLKRGSLALAFIALGCLSAHADYFCRTPSISGNVSALAKSNYCASEAFITSHFPSSSTAGHVATFADSSGNVLQDGGAGGSVTNIATSGGVTGGPITTTGTLSTGPGVDTNIGRTVTSAPSISNSDCGNPIFLSGNALYTVSVGAASGFSAHCRLIFINIDSYTGSGTGRGKSMAINGITQHILYPGQELDIRQNDSATAWIPDQQLTGSIGQQWYPGVAPTFFIDTGGSDGGDKDGLASGASGSFASIGRCIAIAGQLIVNRNGSTVFCKATAGQSFTESVNILYYNQAQIPFQIQSTSNGSSFTWNCPSAQVCIQFGDYGGAQLQDIAFVMNNNAIITGHQIGILDLESNVSFQGNSGSFPAISCDYSSHFNILSGITYSGTLQLVFNACAGSTWNINGTIAASSSPTVGRFFNAASGAKMFFQGNVSFTGSPSVSVALISGNSVVNNLSGATFPGGTPTPTTGGQYCTSAC